MMKSIGFIIAPQSIAWVNCDGMQRMFFIVIEHVLSRYNRLAVFFFLVLSIFFYSRLASHDKKRMLHAVQPWILA